MARFGVRQCPVFMLRIFSPLDSVPGSASPRCGAGARPHSRSGRCRRNCGACCAPVESCRLGRKSAASVDANRRATFGPMWRRWRGMEDGHDREQTTRGGASPHMSGPAPPMHSTVITSSSRGFPRRHYELPGGSILASHHGFIWCLATRLRMKIKPGRNCVYWRRTCLTEK